MDRGQPVIRRTGLWTSIDETRVYYNRIMTDMDNECEIHNREHHKYYAPWRMALT